MKPGRRPWARPRWCRRPPWCRPGRRGSAPGKSIDCSSSASRILARVAARGSEMTRRRSAVEVEAGHRTSPGCLRSFSHDRRSQVRFNNPVRATGIFAPYAPGNDQFCVAMLRDGASTAGGRRGERTWCRSFRRRGRQAYATTLLNPVNGKARSRTRSSVESRPCWRRAAAEPPSASRFRRAETLECHLS